MSTGSAVRGGFAGTPGAGCRALVLAPGTMDQDEILAAVGDGLYVQSVTGVHSGVNPVSGDFSVGAEGLMVRDGTLAEPVREVTVASTLQRMLQSIVHVGADVEWLPGIAAGQTLAIGDMQLSGSLTPVRQRRVAGRGGCVSGGRGGLLALGRAFAGAFLRPAGGPGLALGRRRLVAGRLVARTVCQPVLSPDALSPDSLSDEPPPLLPEPPDPLPELADARLSVL